MVTFARSLVVLTLLLSLGACASEPEMVMPMPAEPDAFAAGLASFESAYVELNSAIDATPEWETRPEFAARVRGLSDLAEYRAEELRYFVPQDLISNGAIDMMKGQARKRAMVNQNELPLAGGTFLEGTANQLDSFAAESAYHRVSEKIVTLEAFSMARMSTPWLDTHVVAHDRADLETIVSTDLDQALSWKRLGLSEKDFLAGRARAQIVLDRLDWDSRKASTY